MLSFLVVSALVPKTEVLVQWEDYFIVLCEIVSNQRKSENQLLKYIVLELRLNFAQTICPPNMC